LIEVIKAAAVAGEAENVSIVKHLRELLAKMHAEYNAQTENLVDPKVFQLGVAYGAAEDANRNAMDGSDQQDAFEYYQLLLNILLEDEFVTDKAALKELFEIETSTHDKCTSSSCGHKYASRIAVNSYHTTSMCRSLTTTAEWFRWMSSSSRRSSVRRMKTKSVLSVRPVGLCLGRSSLGCRRVSS
jgi:hypothetical protein